MRVRAIQHKNWLNAVWVYQTTQLKKEERINIDADKKLGQMINLHQLIIHEQTHRRIATFPLSKSLVPDTNHRITSNINHPEYLFNMVKLI